MLCTALPVLTLILFARTFSKLLLVETSSGELGSELAGEGEGTDYTNTNRSLLDYTNSANNSLFRSHKFGRIIGGDLRNHWSI